MNNYLKIFSIVSLILMLASCGGSDKPQTTSLKTYEVKPQPLHKTLHFTGTVQPLRESSLTSPMEAVVETMHFHYGQMVKKGEIVLTLNSNELQKQYNDTLTDYLKAKDSYSIAKAKFVGTEELWNAGLISKNNYLSEKSGLDTARVTLMQATRKLSEMLEKMDDKNTQNISNLSLADFDKVRKILTSNHNLIHLKAPSDGIMLYPPKSGEDKNNRVTVGSTIKSGQVIALIGDLNGISVEIDVPEIDIDKIRPGMDATISGVAFGRHQLKGKLVAVNAQASNTSTGGLPSFTAVVEVNSLTPEQQSWIKVGMSASIELNVESNNQLLIPIAAVKREKGSSVVQVQLAKGKIQKRMITTGAAQADSVVVESGLKSGDVVVYD
ncbi:TPA: HlyD family efflux transporter periplasmic adaptor subunit [Legionella pneumophila]|uniref:efflux RND transporter periplasmic adaptor subunit n=1 Tax=Legionella pneumophila TaxID=446 RepID=UPI00048DB070|nr:efflux RND transporter periplasmic adaptor subunit [Legionella pneumophila]RYB41127.1 HlyD family efflux transporter periplasmic adaptor subunit [Legionella pneumophila]RYW29559.1 HlyD family efflux transporter periplasmic adaptor subunit [Legionella pneumophila]HAT1821896.1 HlyD family efflux transporter periplasmic adaptor subunit [Legionella pneumophila]HAT1866940.1 HlyD family efflux transporter periplasmic adaptor subunit [Legionella pneumophila]HAT1907067.1 HlyD family efflux transpor